MRNLFLFGVMFLFLLTPISYGYNYAKLGSGHINSVEPEEDEKRITQSIFVRASRGGYVKNSAPITTLNYPTDYKVVNGNFVEFGWSYNDFEKDTQVNYQLELDDDSRFLTPFTYYGLSETNNRIYILQGNIDYYWRVKSKDDFGWGDFSEVGAFHLDSSKRVCEDGTIYSQCSVNNFKYCDNGELREDCSLCGCPINSECTLSGVCREKTCFDGTKFGFCNKNKQPKFCQNGQIKEVCSLCGCPEGKECNQDGTCKTILIKEEITQNIDIKSNKNNLIFKFINFLRSIL